MTRRTPHNGRTRPTSYPLDTFEDTYRITPRVVVGTLVAIVVGLIVAVCIVYAPAVIVLVALALIVYFGVTR